MLTTAWLVVAAALAACDRADDETAPLRVGVLPDQSPQVLKHRYLPLLTYLSAALGRKTELVVPRDYADLVEKFAQGKIDVALFGGLTFVRAAQRSGAVPMVMRSVDARFTSTFLVRADDPAKSIDDLRGRVLAFGSRLSTSGHLMPRHFLREGGRPPERFFATVKYSGAHDKTAYMVRDGGADVGAVNSVIARAMFADGRLSRKTFRVLWVTPPYPNYVWATRKQISRRTRKKLTDAFLALSKREPSQAVILSRLGARYYLPAHAGQFDLLSRTARETGLLGGQRAETNGR